MTPRTSHEENDSFGQDIFSFGFSSLTLIAIDAPLRLPIYAIHPY